MKRALVAGCVAALVLAAPGIAGAGINGTMQANPNPALLNDVIVVSNTNDVNSTCESPGQVELQLFDPTMTLADSALITPDGSGNWTYQFTGDQLGTWVVSADCLRVPTALPDYPYTDLPILVQQPPTTTTTSTTSTTAPSTTTTAPVVAVTPAFTG